MAVEPSPGIPGNCPFCQQSLSGDALITCGRCRTLYHPGCWEANKQRCAVYACAPHQEPSDTKTPSIARPDQLTSRLQTASALFAILVLAGVGTSYAIWGKHQSQVKEIPRLSEAELEENRLEAERYAQFLAEPIVKRLLVSDVEFGPLPSGVFKYDQARIDGQTHRVKFAITNYAHFSVRNVRALVTLYDVVDKQVWSQEFTSQAEGSFPEELPMGGPHKLEVYLSPPKSAARCSVAILRATER